MFPVTWMRFNGEHYTHLEIWLNPRFVVGLLPLIQSDDDAGGPLTRIWLEPEVCVKGIGVPVGCEVMETIGEVRDRIASI